jgi:hypothetical protein
VPDYSVLELIDIPVHDCSLAFLRFLLRDGVLCNAIRIMIRQTSDVFGVFADSRKVSFKLTPFFIGNLVFRVPFLFAALFSPGAYRYPRYLYNLDHVFEEWFSSFISSQAKTLGWVIVTSCSVLEYWVFNASKKNKCWVYL